MLGRLAATVLAALLFAGAGAACSSGDSAGEAGAGDDQVELGDPATTLAPVVAFVRPRPGSGAVVEFDDGTWACEDPSRSIPVGVPLDDGSFAPTAEDAALLGEDPTEVTVELIGEQLNAPPANPGEPHVDLAAFALRRDGALVAVKVVEHADAGWIQGGSTSCD